ncbi:hypothetical protein [Spirochaeta isovalerica]|uniref:HTH araC/xylS-type domain-containing protein n=1 Tax=Spirochaeta isovalerica TaxID=150 RepID=A0A841R6F8_9SPIO|nr:hypothetical protein [Spirochaeta isovalerica]MBB6479423.1 hypothetical protein [Spirochaeta isovalerica]
MYIVPDLLERQFPQMSRGYFALKGFPPEDKLNILCNWICYEMTVNRRSWLSIREELMLDDDNTLEKYFLKVTGFTPADFSLQMKKIQS